ncbi:DUF6538 domain-containing protein [Mesorhizobium sp.]|uniref:DUF6538 domain-containing protein n=1 Tax=Mesorhizobium sp. TaxID=1871066 RepID=UPI00338FE12A
MATLPERMMTRSGTFYCRIWVPTDIAPIYGRQIVVRSLRTKDLKQPSRVSRARAGRSAKCKSSALNFKLRHYQRSNG